MATTQWTISNHGVQITAYDYLAGGIGSLKYKGMDYAYNILPSDPRGLTVSDHGQQIQSAGEPNDPNQKEVENPTECGAWHATDGTIPNKSSSILKGIRTDNNILETQCQMAYFKPYKGRNTSGVIHSKRVEIIKAGLIDYRVSFTLDKIYPSYKFEVLTGYTLPEFNTFYKFKKGKLVKVKKMINHPDANRANSKTPIVSATADGKHAIGVYTVPRGGDDWKRTYTVANFTKERITKWNSAWRRGNTQGRYDFQSFVMVGTLGEVEKLMNEVVK